MMADAQTNYLIDWWTNCETATRNLSGDWLRCYDLLFILRENFKPLICKMPSAVKSSLFSRNVAWCLKVKHTFVREISLLIWTIYSVLFNFPFEINMTTLNNALQNSPTSSWADITITIFNLTSWAGVFFEFLVCCCFLFLHLSSKQK